jgi:hypothetical protein
MQIYNKFRDEAEKKLRIADHMLTITYPLVNDPKLLLAVVENINFMIDNTLSYLLYYERIMKRVPAFLDNFDSKFRIFVEKVAPMYEINKEYFPFLQKINHIVVSHYDSPMEFSRKDKFVICSADYELESFDDSDMKRYLQIGKSFFSDIKIIVKRNESLERD